VAAARAVDIRVLFKEQELSNIIWALGKLQHADLDVFQLLLQEATDKLQFFLPQVRRAPRCLPLLPPPPLAVPGGLAGLQPPPPAGPPPSPPPLFPPCAQGIANIAWSVAAQGVDPGAFFPRVVRMHGHNLAAFDVQALANLLWGMATCGYRNEPFQRAALQEAGRRLERMAPQHLCNLLWSWAALGGCRDAGMLAAWAQHTVQVRARRRRGSPEHPPPSHTDPPTHAHAPPPAPHTPTPRTCPASARTYRMAPCSGYPLCPQLASVAFWRRN
jgi:hypothetical protein